MLFREQAIKVTIRRELMVKLHTRLEEAISHSKWEVLVKAEIL